MKGCVAQLGGQLLVRWSGCVVGVAGRTPDMLWLLTGQDTAAGGHPRSAGREQDGAASLSVWVLALRSLLPWFLLVRPWLYVFM